MSEPLDPKTIKQLGHEARQPLVSLISTANLLLAGLAGEMSEEARKNVEAMRLNAEEGLRSMDDLIEMLKK